MSHESAAKIVALRSCVDSFLVRMTKNLESLDELMPTDVQLRAVLQQLSRFDSFTHDSANLVSNIP